MKEIFPWIILALLHLAAFRLFASWWWGNARFEKFYSFLVEVKELPFSEELLKEVFAYRDSLPSYDEIFWALRKWSFDAHFPDMDAHLVGFLGQARLINAS